MRHKFAHLANPPRRVVQHIQNLDRIESHSGVFERFVCRIPDLADRLAGQTDRLSVIRAEPIADSFTLELGYAAVGLLAEEGIRQVGDLERKSEADLAKIKQIGPRRIEGIKSRLADLGGLHLRRTLDHKPG